MTRKLTTAERFDIVGVLDSMFREPFSDYATRITDVVKEGVFADVEECADDAFSDEDVRLAAGRTVLKKFGIDV